ncbi:MAG: hypothetical protein QXZ70_01020 [Candidatus Bathyarchaeia archaeon]
MIEKTKLIKQILSVLQDGISTIFRDMGFHVANVSFTNMISDQQMAQLISDFYQRSEVAKELLYFPDLFAMHSKKDPREGVFFIHCLSAQVDSAKSNKFVEIESERVQIFARYFPCDRIIMVCSQPNSSATVLAQWLPNCLCSRSPGASQAFKIDLHKMDLLKTFTKTALKMTVDEELLGRLDKELMKIYKLH